jgi:hypothetical protein
LTMYTTGYCTKVQRGAKAPALYILWVPRLAKLTCVGALAVPRSESVTLIIRKSRGL